MTIKKKNKKFVKKIKKNRDEEVYKKYFLIL